MPRNRRHTPSRRAAFLAAFLGHLKRGSSGHLLHGNSGHLVDTCGSGCCLACPQSPTICLPTQWTVSFTGVTIDTSCQSAEGLAVSASGTLDGTYAVPSYAPSPTNIWQTSTDNVQWEEDDGDDCVTPPDLSFRIRFQDNSGTLTLLVDGGATASDLRLFLATIPTPADYPCGSMTFTNSLITCGTDGVHYDHGCGGIAIVTPC